MNANLPMLSELSSAGCKRLQKDAATITPAANPVNIRLSLSDISFLRKKHHRSTKRCSDKRDQDTNYNFRSHMFHLQSDYNL
jgi:hypothetical protein